jgi:hypothetical protein
MEQFAEGLVIGFGMGAAFMCVVYILKTKKYI